MIFTICKHTCKNHKCHKEKNCDIADHEINEINCWLCCCTFDCLIDEIRFECFSFNFSADKDGFFSFLSRKNS